MTGVMWEMPCVCWCCKQRQSDDCEYFSSLSVVCACFGRAGDSNVDQEVCQTRMLSVDLSDHNT